MRAQSGDPRALAGAVRGQLNELDPSLPLANVRMMEDVLSRAQARPRFLTLLLTLFSVWRWRLLPWEFMAWCLIRWRGEPRSLACGWCSARREGTCWGW